MRKKRILGLLTVLLVLGLFGQVRTAGALLYDLGPGSYLDLSGTGPNLQVQGYVNPNLDSLSFNLEVGQSTSFWLGNFYTRESRIDPHDTRVSSFNAFLDFGTFTAKVPGQSFGFTTAYQGDVNQIKPLFQSVYSLLSNYPHGGLTPQQIIQSMDWSIVPADLRGQYEAGLSLILERYAVGGVIPRSSADRLLASLPDPSTIEPEGFSQGYFVTFNDNIPTLPDGTPDYGQNGWIRIDETPVDVYFGPVGHLRLELTDVFKSGLFWLEPGYCELPVLAKITHLSDPLPEPGTLLFLVTGLAGVVGVGAGRRRGNRVVLP